MLTSNMKHKMYIVIFLLIFCTTIQAKSIRRFSHVKTFYKDITEMTIELSVKHNAPPAVILAIAGLESGYGQGYVAQITGNILSLGVNKNETQLPALHLPKVIKTNKIIFDAEEIAKYTEAELSRKQRPPSLKKDYRPSSIRGSKDNLSYLLNHPESRAAAHKQNILDFLTIWLNEDYVFPVFVELRKFLDMRVEENGKDILFDRTLNEELISMMSGKPDSFNLSEDWAGKVKWIMNNAMLLELTKNLYYDKLNFEEAWENYKK
jgi:hypothetical protein